MPSEPRDRARRALASAVRTGRIPLDAQEPAAQEVLERLSLAERHLAEAAHLVATHHPILASPYDRAYDACVVAATALVTACGFTARGDAGHERALVGAQLVLRELGHPSESRLLDELKSRVRPVRHASVYTALDAVTPSALRRLLDIAGVLVPLLAHEAAALAGVEDREPTDWGSLFPTRVDP
jgi:hypothetical protein